MPGKTFAVQPQMINGATNTAVYLPEINSCRPIAQPDMYLVPSRLAVRWWPPASAIVAQSLQVSPPDHRPRANCVTNRNRGQPQRLFRFPRSEDPGKYGCGPAGYLFQVATMIDIDTRAKHT